MNKKSNISSWLSKLQRESWELELLISGFTIFLLIHVPGILNDIMDYVRSEFIGGSYTYNAVTLLASLAIYASYTLIISLAIHLTLRGFWIAVIGLRSVYPDGINYENLKYSDWFKEKLRNKTPPLDNMAVTLDNRCSLIFGFSFLIILILLSLCLYLLYLLIFLSIQSGILGWFRFLRGWILLYLFIGGILYLIDFLTMGLLKKIRIVGKVYYYVVYRIFNIITLAFLYRTIYYTYIRVISFTTLLVGFLPFFAPFRYAPLRKKRQKANQQRGETNHV